MGAGSTDQFHPRLPLPCARSECGVRQSQPGAVAWRGPQGLVHMGLCDRFAPAWKDGVVLRFVFQRDSSELFFL